MTKSWDQQDTGKQSTQTEFFHGMLLFAAGIKQPFWPNVDGRSGIEHGLENWRDV
jgi:hypothetical protein